MSFAAFQNIEPAWHAIFEKMGLNVVVVTFITSPISPIHAHPEIEKALGLALQQVNAGYYDSSFYHPARSASEPASVWFFFHSRNLGAAMALLKSQIAARNLLGITNILHAESSGRFVIWYSYDPTDIAQAIEG